MTSPFPSLWVYCLVVTFGEITTYPIVPISAFEFHSCPQHYFYCSTSRRPWPRVTLLYPPSLLSMMISEMTTLLIVVLQPRHHQTLLHLLFHVRDTLAVTVMRSHLDVSRDRRSDQKKHKKRRRREAATTRENVKYHFSSGDQFPPVARTSTMMAPPVDMGQLLQLAQAFGTNNVSRPQDQTELVCYLKNNLEEEKATSMRLRHERDTSRQKAVVLERTVKELQENQRSTLSDTKSEGTILQSSVTGSSNKKRHESNLTAGLNQFYQRKARPTGFPRPLQSSFTSLPSWSFQKGDSKDIPLRLGMYAPIPGVAMKIIAEEALAKPIPYSRDSRHSSFEGLSLVSDFCSPRQLAMITALVTDPAEEDFTLRQPHDSQAAPGLHQRQYGFRRILFGAAGSPCFQFARSLLGIRHRVPLLFQNLYGQARPHMKGYKTHQQVQNVDMLLYGEGDHESWQYDGVVPEECNKEAIVTVLNLGCTAVWEFLRRR